MSDDNAAWVEYEKAELFLEEKRVEAELIDAKNAYRANKTPELKEAMRQAKLAMFEVHDRTRAGRAATTAQAVEEVTEDGG